MKHNKKNLRCGAREEKRKGEREEILKQRSNFSKIEKTK